MLGSVLWRSPLTWLVVVFGGNGYGDVENL
jgi:hypothetical protein